MASSIAKRRNLLHLEGGSDHHRNMEETLQYKETAQCVGLPPTSPGNHRADGNQAGHALTFKLDHSMGPTKCTKVNRTSAQR